MRESIGSLQRVELSTHAGIRRNPSAIDLGGLGTAEIALHSPPQRAFKICTPADKESLMIAPSARSSGKMPSRDGRPQSPKPCTNFRRGAAAGPSNSSTSCKSRLQSCKAGFNDELQFMVNNIHLFYVRRPLYSYPHAVGITLVSLNVPVCALSSRSREWRPLLR